MVSGTALHQTCKDPCHLLNTPKYPPPTQASLTLEPDMLCCD
uniref:Uncharacterized protein n=1 Tax=Anguilla anguilla TaxID=7936 RepID=A0A0E9TI22_ANGAN